MGFLTKKSSYYEYCQDCELVFSNPYANIDDLSIYYDEYNFESPLREESFEDLLSNLTQENISHLSNYEAVSKYVKQLPNKGRCLDIGGGYGGFCQFNRNLRADLDIELRDFRIDEELKRVLSLSNITAVQCNIARQNFGQNEYDLITNWEVIEHLDLNTIRDYFKRVYDALKVGGYYIFSTPDFNDPLCRALDFWAMAPGEHVSVLSINCLESVFNDIGFSVVDEMHESVTFKLADRWFKYGSEANASFASRAESWIINDLQKDNKILESYRQSLRDRNIGSELILVLKK